MSEEKEETVVIRVTKDLTEEEITLIESNLDAFRAMFEMEFSEEIDKLIDKVSGEVGA